MLLCLLHVLRGAWGMASSSYLNSVFVNITKMRNFTLFFFSKNYNEEHTPSILDMVFQYKIQQLTNGLGKKWNKNINRDWCIVWERVLYLMAFLMVELSITLLKYVRQGWLSSHLIIVVCLCSMSNIGDVAQYDYRCLLFISLFIGKSRQKARLDWCR